MILTSATSICAAELPPAKANRLRCTIEGLVQLRGVRLAVIASVVLVYAALAVGQALTKHPWMDEAWFASPAITLLTKGYMGTPVLESLGKLDKYFFYNPPLFILAQAGWFKVFGFSLFSLRTLSMFWGLVAMTSWFFIVRGLTGNRNLALLTFSLVALDVVFVRGAAFGRMDMMSAALGFAAYATYISLRQRSLIAAIFVSQTLVVLSGLTHPNGRVEFVGLLFLTLAFDRSRLQWRHAAVAVLPYLAGGATWGAYILRDPSLFLFQFRENIGQRWIGFHPLTILKRELTYRYLATYGFGPQQTGARHVLIIFLIVYVLGIAMALGIREIRQNSGYRMLLVLLAIPCFVLSLSVDYNPAEYMVNIVPLFAAILAVSVHWLWTKRPFSAGAVTVGVAIFILLNVGALANRIAIDDYHKSYLPAVDFIRQNSNPSMLIMGNANLAFGLGFPQNFLDDKELGYRSGKRADMIVVDDEWEQLFQMQKDRGRIDLYRYIQSTLETEYRPIYHRGVYKILIRNEGSTNRASAPVELQRTN